MAKPRFTRPGPRLGDPAPFVWQHDLCHPDLTPYQLTELAEFKQLIAALKSPPAARRTLAYALTKESGSPVGRLCPGFLQLLLKRAAALQRALVVAFLKRAIEAGYLLEAAVVTNFRYRPAGLHPLLGSVLQAVVEHRASRCPAAPSTPANRR